MASNQPKYRLINYVQQTTRLLVGREVHPPSTEMAYSLISGCLDCFPQFLIQETDRQQTQIQRATSVYSARTTQ